MGDMAEVFNAMNSHKKKVRAKYGVPCPECVVKLPRTNPSLLIPQQICKIHKYKDPRKPLTREQHQELDQ